MPGSLRGSAGVRKTGVKEESRQILTFLLNGQDYGVELVRVQEIRGYTEVTPIPHLPAHIKGMLNLRGSILPVIDLRLKFGMEAIGYTKFTVVIIARSRGKNVGLIVDSVSDVLAAAEGQIQPAPDFGEPADMRFVAGLLQSGEGGRGKGMVVVLELDQLLTESEVSAACEA